MRTPETRADILVDHAKRAMAVYTNSLLFDSEQANSPSLGRYLDNWKDNTDMTKIIGETTSENGGRIFKARVVYEPTNETERLIFRARSHGVSPGENPLKLVDAWSQIARQYWKKGLKSIPPSVDILLQKPSDQPGGRLDTERIRFELRWEHPYNSPEIITKARVATCINHLERIDYKPSTSKEVAQMYQEIFARAMEP